MSQMRTVEQLTSKRTNPGQTSTVPPAPELHAERFGTTASPAEPLALRHIHHLSSPALAPIRMGRGDSPSDACASNRREPVTHDAAHRSGPRWARPPHSRLKSASRSFLLASRSEAFGSGAWHPGQTPPESMHVPHSEAPHAWRSTPGA